MKYLFFFTLGIFAHTLFNNRIDYADAVRVAYQQGRKEAFDDIGVKRITIHDINHLITEEECQI